MPSPADKAATFRALHERPGAFIIPNPWDAGTARLLAALGFEALATTSLGLANMLGRADSQVSRAGGDRELPRHRRRDGPAGECRPGERLRPCTPGGGRGDPARRRSGRGRRFDRGRDRRSQGSDLRLRSLGGACPGGGRGRPCPAGAVPADGARREPDPWPHRHGRYDPPPAGLRRGRRRRALCARPAQSRGSPAGRRAPSTAR